MFSQGPKRTLSLVPFNGVNLEILTDLSRSLMRKFRLECEIDKSLDVPRLAYDSGRKQYRSSLLMDQLKRHDTEAQHLLGVIDCDLYDHKHNFVFGEADMVVGVAIVSVTRFKQEFRGLIPEKKVFMNRVLIQCLHELGHTWGLQDCRDPYCSMYISFSMCDFDRKAPGFCRSCMMKLGII
jgi:archaemetzincin